MNLNNPYGYRDDNLRSLGFKSYRAYLASALWATIRARVLDRCEGRCERCWKRPATQVHHRAYDPATLRGDSTDALTAACGGCHYRAEFKQKAGGTLGQARYQRLMQANDSILKAGAKVARKIRRAKARRAGGDV